MARKIDFSSLPIIGQVFWGDFFEFFSLWDARYGSSLVLVVTCPKIDRKPVWFHSFFWEGDSFFLSFALFLTPKIWAESQTQFPAIWIEGFLKFAFGFLLRILYHLYGYLPEWVNGKRKIFPCMVVSMQWIALNIAEFSFSITPSSCAKTTPATRDTGYLGGRHWLPQHWLPDTGYP
jgi:hypothetical protein